MDDVLLILAAMCLAWGFGVALVFRIIPAAVTALKSRRPLARTSAYLRMTWSAR